MLRNAAYKGMQTGVWTPARDFIETDVLRWTEGIFESRRRKGKARKIGEREVVAEVQSRGGDGWIRLLVRRCIITRDECAGQSIPPLKPETLIRRNLKTVLRGNPQRLLWSDESARAAVVASPDRGRE
jgi:hypothetical protein